jgi:hypothetical protein
VKSESKVGGGRQPKLPEQQWGKIKLEIGARQFSCGDLSTARVTIEFLRETALIHEAAGERYQESAARKSRATRYVTKARLELEPYNFTELKYIKHLDEMFEADADHHESRFPVRDDLLENLMLLWKRWGGDIAASFNNHRGGGPLVRFLLASSDDLFPLTENSARTRVQVFKKRTLSNR